MQANELRIGNKLLVYDNIDTIGEVSYNSIICGYTGYSNLDKGYVEPIPLTEEILLKCGFVKVKNKDKEDLREYIGHTSQKARYAIFDTDIFITKVDKRGLLWRNIECDFMVLFYHKSIPIKYLHQLQNLYFVLTGQELEINL